MSAPSVYSPFSDGHGVSVSVVCSFESLRLPEPLWTGLFERGRPAHSSHSTNPALSGLPGAPMGYPPPISTSCALSSNNTYSGTPLPCAGLSLSPPDGRLTMASSRSPGCLRCPRSSSCAPIGRSATARAYQRRPGLRHPPHPPSPGTARAWGWKTSLWRASSSSPHCSRCQGRLRNSSMPRTRTTAPILPLLVLRESRVSRPRARQQHRRKPRQVVIPQGLKRQMLHLQELRVRVRRCLSPLTARSLRASPCTSL